MNYNTPSPRRLLLIGIMTGICGLINPASAQVINEDFKMLPADGAPGFFFGRSIAIDNGIVAVGADGVGHAYTFNATTGAQLALLVPNDPPSNSFGYSVDVQNGIAVVGARWDADNGGNSGSAYIFDAITGVQLSKLLPTDGAAESFFGRSISIDNGIVAVGASRDNENGNRSGAAYTFDAITGVQIAKLLAEDGAQNDELGFSIAIQNGIVAVGAKGDSNVAPISGAVYLFDALTGVQIAKILPDDGGLGDAFGASVAIDNGILAVGSDRDNINTNDNGSAYLFDITTHEQLFKLWADDTAGGDQLGFSIGIDNGVLVVGAHQDRDNGNNSGSAYLFDVATGTQIAKLLPTDGGTDQRFGSSVAVSDGVAVAGAILFGSGTAYAFTVPPLPCLPDINDDGLINFFDITAFVSAFLASDPAADFTNDGLYDFFDVSAFLAAYKAGCP
jgi:FG-GAP repeat